MEKILVLMSTYNGEKYLDVQLDSILNQDGVDVHILARDDGSRDRTLAILHDYASKYSNITVLEESNCGAIRSFYSLMNYAVKHYSDYKYFAFSDQDDYWYPHKLERAISMNVKGADNYLYHSCYDIVDKELNLLKKTTNKNSVGTLGEALITNPSIGCSEVFTFEVLKNSSKIYNYQLEDSRYYPYHDLWVYLVALATKADVCFDSECGLKYRQHGHNVIGTGKGMIETMKLQHRNLVKAKNLKSGFAKILLNLIEVDDDVRVILTHVIEYRMSFWKKLRLLNADEFKLKDKPRRFALIYSVLTGMY